MITLIQRSSPDTSRLPREAGSEQSRPVTNADIRTSCSEVSLVRPRMRGGSPDAQQVREVSGLRTSRREFRTLTLNEGDWQFLFIILQISSINL